MQMTNGKIKANSRKCMLFLTILNFRYVPRYLFDRSFFPNYLDGGSGFVFTMETAAKLYNASLEMPLFLFEDVYFTGGCTAVQHTLYVDYFNFSRVKRFLLHLQVFALRRQTLSQGIQFISTMHFIRKYVCLKH